MPMSLKIHVSRKILLGYSDSTYKITLEKYGYNQFKSVHQTGKILILYKMLIKNHFPSMKL